MPRRPGRGEARGVQPGSVAGGEAGGQNHQVSFLFNSATGKNNVVSFLIIILFQQITLDFLLFIL